LEPVDFDEPGIAAVAGCAERALLVLTEATNKVVVVGKELNRGEVALGEVV
jgi:hypothetical protein